MFYFDMRINIFSQFVVEMISMRLNQGGVINILSKEERFSEL
jgi:hypothetical protein